MSFGAAILGLGAFQATSQYQAGQQQAKAISQQAEYNAQVYDQQAETIKNKQKLQERSDLRNAARYRGAAVASAASRGLLLSGSPLSMLIDSETELQLDSAVAQYNLNLDRHFAKTQAQSTRTQGRYDSQTASRMGTMGAFSTLLSTGISYGQIYGNPFKKR